MTDLQWSYRSMELDDVPLLLPWYNDRQLHETANARPFAPYTLEELYDYWREKLGRKKAKYFAIFIENTLIGRAGLKKIGEGPDMEYSILIGSSEHYSRGLGTAVTKRMLAEAFSNPNIESVQLDVRMDNGRAIRCYEKCGFKEAGIMLEHNVEMKKMKIRRQEFAG